MPVRTLAGAYLARTHLREAHLLGVAKKVQAQVTALATLPAELTLVHADREGILRDGRLVERLPSGTPWQRWRSARRFHAYCADLPVPLDFIYLRYQGSSPSLLAMLRRLRRRHPGLRILVEIPSFPYDAEAHGLRARLKLAVDRLFRGRLRHYVDRIVTFSQCETIFGIPTLRTDNGVDVDAHPLLPAPPSPEPVRLVGLANLSVWHGYDRVIQGLADYYAGGGTRDIRFDIVGTGAELGPLKARVAALGMGTRVEFHGALDGAALDAVLGRAHVAVSSLGIHRVQMDSSTIKAREFCARGLPFILGAEDRDFGPGLDFVHRVPADESPVDLRAILDFVDGLQPRAEALRHAMRAYAEANLTWHAKLAPVLGFLRECTGARTP